MHSFINHLNYVVLFVPAFFAGAVLAIASVFQSFRKEW